MNIGFYGGRPGQDFSIKEIFPTKVELDADLNKSWTSPISVGEFVVISYGSPNESIIPPATESEYDRKKSIDLAAYGKSFNSTLWRKEYQDDGSGSASGLSYKLIASMTGNTPRIHLIDDDETDTDDITILDADQMPNVEWDNSDPDFLYLKFYLPQSQVLQYAQEKFQILDANQDPAFFFDDETDINKPRFWLHLPQSQVVERLLVTVAESNVEPSVYWDDGDEDGDEGNVNNPILKFTLPKAQLLQLGETVIANADVLPEVDLDSSDPSRPVLTLTLPRAQIMTNPTTEIVGPIENPHVTLNDDDINHPYLQFKLPRATKFYYGSYLGERTSLNKTYTLESADFANYAIGDYYINEATGFIYLITAKTGNTCTFVYQASIQQPLPEVEATAIAPYELGPTGAYIPATPEISRKFTDNEKSKWKLIFGLPQAPNPKVETTWIGPEEEGAGGTVEPTNETDITFNLKIRQGAKIHSGIEVYDGAEGQSVDIGASIGDLYLNNDTGFMYKWKGGLWEKQNGCLKGPVGDALYIIREYTIEAADVAFTDNLIDVSNYIVNKLYIQRNDDGTPILDDNGDTIPVDDPHPDEIFAINWVDVDEDGSTSITSYWYYYTEENKWGRVQLTGGVAGLLANEYQDDSAGPITDKTYTVSYINSLIGGKIEDIEKQAFSAEQIYALLSWGEFPKDTTETPDWFPEDSTDETTLSAEEVIELMSWGTWESII